jgi:hypothetical protein
LPPAIAAAAAAAIVHLKTSGAERAGQRSAVAATKAALREAGLPVMATETRILPVMVGDPDLCKQASGLLLDRDGIYIQPINYPTVAPGTERLGITPNLAHDAGLIGQLAEAMVSVWHELDLPLGSDHPEQMLQLWNRGAPWTAAACAQAIPLNRPRTILTSALHHIRFPMLAIVLKTRRCPSANGFHYASEIAACQFPNLPTRLASTNVRPLVPAERPVSDRWSGKPESCCLGLNPNISRYLG